MIHEHEHEHEHELVVRARLRGQRSKPLTTLAEPVPEALTDRVLECPDARVRSGEVVPICMVGLEGLLALRSSRREVFHADSLHRKTVLDQGRRKERACPLFLMRRMHCMRPYHQVRGRGSLTRYRT